MTTIRRASLATLAILVLEYGIGVYVSLYATVPRAEHGASIAIAVMTGVALLCYAANLYLHRTGLPGRRRYHRGRELAGLMGG